MYSEIVKRLHRYSENCVAYKLDADFADAVQQAADAIEELSMVCDNLNFLNKHPWIPVTERLPVDFEPVYAALRSEGREDWVIEVEAYDPYLTCPWGQIPLIETGKAHVYAWMPRPLPEPPKEE